MSPNQKPKKVIPKNTLIYPAKGTVIIFCFFDNKRCSIREKISAQGRSTIKEIEAKPKMRKKNSKISPNPITSLKLVLSLSLV